MRRSRLIVALLVAFAAACAPQQGQQFTPIGGEPEAPPGQPSTPSGQPAPQPAAAAPRVTNVTIALDEGGQQPATTIASDAPTVYTVWTVEGVSGTVEVRGRWIAAQVEGLAPDAELSTATQSVQQDTTAAFSLVRPSDGWKPGRYRVEVSAQGAEPRTAEFVIAAPAAQPGPTGTQAGPIEAVLARGATEAGEPTQPTAEFPEDAERLYLTVRSTAERSVGIVATWIAINVEGIEPNKDVATTRLSLSAGQRGAMYVQASRGGFQPGEYRVDVEADGAAAHSLPFKVVAILPPAAVVTPSDQPRGINIALAALGGKIESVSSEYDTGTWAAGHLNDGAAAAWSSRSDPPQEVVFSFYGQREAQISAVVIDPTTASTLRRPDGLAKHVEIWTSSTSPTEGFTKVAGGRLHLRHAEQVIALPSTRAKFVKVRFTSNHGGSYVQAAEIRILESPAGESILADVPKNVALAGLGGTIVRFSSQRSTTDNAARLIDGVTDNDGWRSSDGYLPQDIVLAFRGDRVALIDRVVLNPKAATDQTTWVKTFTIAVSDHPLDSFEEVGQFTLSQRPEDQAFPVRRRARFVRIRVLSNYGSASLTSLGEVRVFEGAEPGYQSILTAPDVAAGSQAGAAPPVDETGVATETEPNNSAGEANPLTLGRRTKGAIDPLGEHDYFSLAVPAAGTLTFEKVGRPYIRTSLVLSDATGRALRRFDPGRVPGNRTEFSWLVRPGQYRVQVTEPPVSIVLIWDTSGSMANSYKDLEVAVNAYLDQVRPSERLKLMRFSDQVEVLSQQFTSDRDALKAAAQGKFFARGGTPLYDAIAEGIKQLDGVTGNRAIIVMTDGEDSGSRLRYPAFWELLEEQRVRIYMIALGEALQKAVPSIASTPNRMMSHVSQATNGRFFFARSSEELTGLYEQIAAELRTTSTYYLRPTLSAGQGTLAVTASGERIAAVSAPPQIELILDASGSMRRRIEGRQMMDVAKDVMSEIIKGLPDGMRVALRFYGHRIREGRRGDCQDTELVVPFGPIDRGRLLERVRAVQALGTTPIAYTLRQVPRDFGNAPGEKLVILVTDGKEECGGSPSAVVSEILARGLKVRLNIVGFALAEAAVKQEMERVARLTGGKYFDAANARALRQAIEQSLAVPYEVLDASGARVAGGLTGQDNVKVPEGIYTVRVQAAGAPIVIRDVRIRQGGFTKIALKKEGQEVGVRVIGP